jgi:hypothetical protein
MISLSPVATAVLSPPAMMADPLKPVRVNACQNCQRVDCQLLPLVTGMTYMQDVVLFPLRTDAVIRLTQYEQTRFKERKGKSKFRIKITLYKRERKFVEKPSCWIMCRYTLSICH